MLFVLLTLPFALYGQTSADCSDFAVTGPSAVLTMNEPYRFEAKFTPSVDASTYTIKWTVDNGKIVSGQGTLAIEVAKVKPGTSIQAVAEVTGLGECDRTASDSLIICEAQVKPFLINEFGELPADELQFRIEKALEELRSDPTASLYWVSYGPEKKVAEFERAVRDLITYRDGENGPDSFVLVNGGIEDELRVRIWIVPAGADSSIVN